MKDLANLDFIRCIAVILVATVHTMLYTGHIDRVGWAGTTGVGIFFVHTTLVLMMSLERDPHLWRFYVRRAFRIYPLWLAVLAIYLLFHVPMSPPFAPAFGFHPPGYHELLANILLTFNFKYQANVVCASWTLPYEVQMYLVLPALFYLTLRSRNLWLFLAIDAAVIAFDRHFCGITVNLPIVFPYFLPGVMAYLLYKRIKPALPAWLLPIWIAAIVIVAYRYGDYRNTWYVCLLIGLSVPFFRQLSWKPFVRINHAVAQYSYGIYLCHAFAIVIGIHFLAGHSMALRVAAYIAVMVAAPVAFYHLLERPMILLGSKLARKIERGPSLRMDERNLSLEPAP